MKIELENEITWDERSKLIREYSPAEFDAIERLQRTLPNFFAGSLDERTSIGRDCGPRFADEEETDETSADAEMENTKETESEPPDNTENEIECGGSRMSAIRFVSFQDASTAEEAESFVVIDTGSAVLPIVGRTVKVTGGFEVHTYSLDGNRKAPGPVPVATHPFHQVSASEAEQCEQIADALVERREFESRQPEQKGWQPYSNPAPDAGKERK